MLDLRISNSNENENTRNKYSSYISVYICVYVFRYGGPGTQAVSEQWGIGWDAYLARFGNHQQQHNFHHHYHRLGHLPDEVGEIIITKGITKTKATQSDFEPRWLFDNITITFK